MLLEWKKKRLGRKNGNGRKIGNLKSPQNKDIYVACIVK